MAVVTVCPKENAVTVSYGLVFVDGIPQKQRKCPKCGTLYVG